jgi:hypothetical protein
MKRSTTRWTTAFAAAALLGLPAAGLTQTPPATTSPAPAAQQPAPRAQGQEGSAQDHIRQAKAALDDVQTASLAARSKTRISELKRHLGSLEKSAASGASAGATAGAKTTARAKSNWASEVAAIDKILTELLGPATTSPAGASTGATGTTGKPASPATLDDATKGKLMEVRTHVTAFAAAMSGAPGPSPDPAPEAGAQPSASPPQEAASAAAAPPQAEPQGQIDAAAAKQHLMAARDSLSQLTQLPAAAQLSGETRTQVSQLIANFNEMIAATTNWRESYTKVNANLTALVGTESASASVEQPAQPAQSGTPGAVGTTGTAAGGLDPTLRAKLVEFREHLVKFEQAAGGGTTSETPSSNSATMTPPSASSSTTPEPAPAEQTPAATSPQNPPAATAPRADATGQTGAVRHIEAIEAILSGRPAASTAAGSTPSATTPPASATAGTSGASANVTLNASQLEQIRMHLSELRKAVDKK